LYVAVFYGGFDREFSNWFFIFAVHRTWGSFHARVYSSFNIFSSAHRRLTFFGILSDFLDRTIENLAPVISLEEEEELLELNSLEDLAGWLDIYCPSAWCSSQCPLRNILSYFGSHLGKGGAQKSNFLSLVIP
jgi:hypothetical protein